MGPGKADLLTLTPTLSRRGRGGKATWNAARRGRAKQRQPFLGLPWGRSVVGVVLADDELLAVLELFLLPLVPLLDGAEEAADPGVDFGLGIAFGGHGCLLGGQRFQGSVLNLFPDT